MNYGKKGIKKTQHSLTSKTIKLKKMCITTILKLSLIAALGVIVVGICLGFGMFKGVLDSAPDITGLDVTPFGKGFVGFILAAVTLYVTQYFVAGYSISWIASIIGALIYGVIDYIIPGTQKM